MPLKQPAIDRRALISGRIADPDGLVAPPGAEIASVLVQARPDRLDEVAAAILGLAGCEIHARDSKGKLVIVPSLVCSAPDVIATVTLLPKDS